MIKKMAHIVDGKVINISLWDGQTLWQPVEEVVQILPGTPGGIGWDYVDGKFVDKRPVENLSDL
jgi:hypothetical protein